MNHATLIAISDMSISVFSDHLLERQTERLPPNYTLDRTAGSHPLARDRST
jgi:hypothetical protein